jgi:flagellar motor switch/type III secretory pathway protein FliN
MTALPAQAEKPAAPDPSDAAWREIQDVRCRLTAELSVHGFTVRDLLLLQKGSVVNTNQSTRARISVRANGSLLALAEFEVVETRLGIRWTEIA